MCAFVLSFLVLCSVSIASLAEGTKSVSGFSVDLIHRDSPLSPFYNPSLTQSQRIRNIALRSIARSYRLGLSQNENGSPKTITTPDPGNGEYLMRFYIGTPPVERFAIADTGSDLIWVQCAPCMKCSPQNTPLFDPRKSSTYRRVRCDSQPCTLLSQNHHLCGRSGECEYSYSYVDNSYNTGILGVESINFGSKGGSNAVKFPKITFGCAYYINEDPDETKMSTGLVGLGSGPLSLVSQLGDQIGYKFSYCLLPMDSNSTSKLKFGNKATIKGKGVVSTPLIIKISEPSYYYLNLEGISIGKKTVKMSKSQTDGNIVIDSGTTYTYLQERFYIKFEKLVKDVLGVEEEKPNPFNSSDFCFRYDRKFPDFSFHFTGAKVRLNQENLFFDYGEDLFCMLVLPHHSSNGGTPVFGNLAQVGFRVEYDLQVGKVSFAPTDCTKY